MMTTALMIQTVVPTPPRPPSLESHSSFHHLPASKMTVTGGIAASPVGSVVTAGQVVVDSSTGGSSVANRIHLVSRQWADDSQAVSAVSRQHLSSLSLMHHHQSSHHANSLTSSPTSSSSPPMSSSPSSSSSPSHLPHLLRSASPSYERIHSHRDHHQTKLSSSSDSTSISSAYSEESTTMTDEDDIVLDLSMPSRKRSYSPELSGSEDHNGSDDQRRIMRTSSSSSSGSAGANGAPGCNKPSYKKSLIKRYCKFCPTEHKCNTRICATNSSVIQAYEDVWNCSSLRGRKRAQLGKLDPSSWQTASTSLRCQLYVVSFLIGGLIGLPRYVPHSGASCRCTTRQVDLVSNFSVVITVCLASTTISIYLDTHTHTHSSHSTFLAPCQMCSSL